ncbi:MAG: hypothetical protein QNK30_01880 [Bacteroidales bacterium]|nr:hypothetical protein [Bacteroidales bacterium]
MKILGSTIVIAFFLLLSLNLIQAQTELNQVELMNKYIGTWKIEVSEDTNSIFEVTAFKEDVLEINSKTVANGKIIYEGKSLRGYDKKSNKYIDVGEDLDYPPALIFTFWWFSSEDICHLSNNEDLNNSEKGTIKSKIEFKSPDLFIQTITKNGKVKKINTVKRVRD